MTNLIISNECNLACSYCFAKDFLQSQGIKEQSKFIQLDYFRELLDYLDRSEINEIRLIGGEPSLHPEFPKLIQLACERNKHIVVFTNGLLSKPALDSLLSLSPEACTVLVNMNTSKLDGPTQKAYQHRQSVIQALGSRALLGYNILNLNFDIKPIIEISVKSNCRPEIRIGLAQPTLSGNNKFLHPNLYPAVGEKLAKYARIAANLGRVFDFDCGFVRCMFSSEAWNMLQAAEVNPGFNCSPILDIDMNKNVLHCFPLASRVHTRLKNTSDATGLRAALSHQVSSYRTAGIYKECSTCIYKQSDECTGGCLANTIRRFRQADFAIRVPENEFITQESLQRSCQ